MLLCWGGDDDGHVTTFSASPARHQHASPAQYQPVTDADERVSRGDHDEPQRRFFTSTNDDSEVRAGAGGDGLFRAFSAADVDDVVGKSPSTSFFFSPGAFKSSDADTTMASDGGGFQLMFGSDPNQSGASDDGNSFTINFWAQLSWLTVRHSALS